MLIKLSQRSRDRRDDRDKKDEKNEPEPEVAPVIIEEPAPEDEEARIERARLKRLEILQRHGLR